MFVDNNCSENPIECEYKHKYPGNFNIEEAQLLVQNLISKLCASSDLNLPLNDLPDAVLHTDVYYDDIHNSLANRGVSCRIRTGPDIKQLTVKIKQNQEKGFFERDEIQQTLSDNQISSILQNGTLIISEQDIHPINMLKKYVPNIGCLMPMITIQTLRREINLQTRAGQSVLCLDIIQFTQGEHKSSYQVEIEIEGIGVEKEELEKFNSNLKAIMPDLIPSEKSKFERALDFIRRTNSTRLPSEDQ